MEKKFYVIGHRGACAYAPENTVHSFDKALEIGVDGLETDIQETKDGVLVLFHDNILDRKSNLKGAVKDYTLDELMQADFGWWFSGEFAGEHIVRLDEFLLRYGKKVHLSLEIKSRGIEEKLLEEITRAGLDIEDYMVTSFDLNSLLQIRKLDHAISVGYLISDCSRKSVNACLEHGFNCICPHSETVSRENVKYAHSKELFVRAWGVGNTDLMKQVYDAGADGMTADFPDKLNQYIANKRI